MSNYRPQIGTPLEQLDTPCMIVDLDALEHNFGVIADLYADSPTKMREHAKNIKTPIILHKQIRAGGTMGGVCTAKTAEAEVMVESGITDILITSQVVTPDKLARISALSKIADIKLSVDSDGPLTELSRISSQMGSNVGVVLEVDTSMGRGGIRAIEQGVELAKLTNELPGVTFKGVMSHQSLAAGADNDRESRFIEGRRYIQMCLDVKDAIEAEGIPVDIVSTGETWTYDVAPEIPGVDEVQGGTYALMATQADYMDAFQYAVKVLSTVISRPDANTAIGDVGFRAMTSPGGVLPRVDGISGIEVETLESDHIVLRSEGDMPLVVGNQFLLLSAQQDIMVNRWDQFVAIRNGKVEAVWPILARGCHH